MARRTLLLIASILTAALGTALIWLYVQGAESRAEQQVTLVPALFLTRELAAGAAVEASALRTKQVTPEVAANAVRDISEVTGKTLTVPATPDQLLLRSMLGAGTNGGGRFPNEGAMALTINDPDRVPADLKAGDTVDVYALGAGGRVRPVVTNIVVRTVGTTAAAGAPTTAAPGSAPGTATGTPVTTVGFEADSRQAQALYGIRARGEQPALWLHGPGGRSVVTP